MCSKNIITMKCAVIKWSNWLIYNSFHVFEYILIKYAYSSAEFGISVGVCSEFVLEFVNIIFHIERVEMKK